MSIRADIRAIAILAIAAFVDIESANATSVVSCTSAPLAPADKAQIDALAKNLVAPQLVDESKNFYCKRNAIAIALFQTVPALAADGALETQFTTCTRNPRWKCALSRERAVDVIEATSSATVRISTRDDLSADRLREVYAAALELAGNDSTIEDPSCHTPADLAQRLRASFVQRHSAGVKVSTDGTLFNVKRDQIEIELSTALQYRCIVQWP